MVPGPHQPMTSARSEPLALPVLRVVDAVTTRTHCPYCAFQCGMEVTTVTAAEAVPAPRPDVRPDPAFPVNRGQMCIKGFTSGDLLDHPGAPHRAADAHARRAAGAGVLGRGARLRRRKADAAARRARSGGAGGVRQRRAHQREGVPAGQVRARGVALAQHRLQRALLHGVGGGRPEQGIRHRPRSAVSGQRHRAHQDAAAVGRELQRDDAADHAVGARAARRRQADRRRSAAHRDRARRRPAPGADAGLGSRAGERPSAPGDRRAARRPRLHRAAHGRLR